MQIEYKSSVKNSYMILIEKKNDRETGTDMLLTEKMLEGRDIDAFLKLRMVPYDDNMTCWYTVTDLIPVSEYVENRKIGGAFFSLLLDSLGRLHDCILNNYLKEEHLFLTAQTVYVNDTGNRFYFCYQPMCSFNVKKQLEKLMEGLLSEIDHQDEAAVALGYGLYQQSLLENGNLWHELSRIAKKTSIRSVTGETDEITEKTDETIGNSTETTGNIVGFTGNLNKTTGNIVGFTGNLNKTTGNLSGFTGNLRKTTGKSGEITGNLGEPAGKEKMDYLTTSGMAKDLKMEELDEKIREESKRNAPWRVKLRQIGEKTAEIINRMDSLLEYKKWDS